MMDTPPMMDAPTTGADELVHDEPFTPTVPVAALGTGPRYDLADRLTSEANAIAATRPGSVERGELRGNNLLIAGRLNDNQHISSAQRIAMMLEDPDMPMADIVGAARRLRHFRVACISGLLTIQRLEEQVGGMSRLFQIEFGSDLSEPASEIPDATVTHSAKPEYEPEGLDDHLVTQDGLAPDLIPAEPAPEGPTSLLDAPESEPERQPSPLMNTLLPLADQQPA
jgi:hypothetical protein